MKKWILRTFFPELGGLVAKWLQEAHDIEEGSSFGMTEVEANMTIELNSCAHQLAEAMGIDLGRRR